MKKILMYVTMRLVRLNGKNKEKEKERGKRGIARCPLITQRKDFRNFSSA